MNWYVLYTASRAEKLVEQRIKAEGVETYLPLHFSPRRWSDRIKMIEVPFIASYIFVRTTDEKLRMLTRLTGVSRIVYYNAQPAIVKPEEIEAIKDFLDKARGKECEFLENDEVQIASGPLKDVKGKVKNKTKEYLILYLEQIGITVKVRLNQVLKK